MNVVSASGDEPPACGAPKFRICGAMLIEQPNETGKGITYIPMSRDFVYQAAVLVGASAKCLAGVFRSIFIKSGLRRCGVLFECSE